LGTKWWRNFGPVLDDPLQEMSLRFDANRTRGKDLT
jgi:hypothetical protein